MKRILIVGAGGQIGSELTTYRRKIYGNDNGVATDVRECKQLAESGPFEVMNADVYKRQLPHNRDKRMCLSPKWLCDIHG